MISDDHSIISGTTRSAGVWGACAALQADARAMGNMDRPRLAVKRAVEFLGSMKAAIYARVSKEKCNLCSHLKSEHLPASPFTCTATKDKQPCKCVGYHGQDPENQLNVLRRYAMDQDWEPVVFVDYETGKHSDRDQFQKLFEAASRHEFSFVVVWALDRFTREGVAETFIHIQRLQRYKVQFESYTKPHFRTTGLSGELMIAIAAWIAKQERTRISERTKAGLQVARHKGKILGRPFRVFPRERVLADRKRGMSWPALERKYGIPQATIRRAVKRLENEPKPGLSKTPPKPICK